ncbi:MAG: methyltransferase domain-containing protein [Thermoguttaceae bacterium]
MPYSHLTVDSRFAIKRFSHRRRFARTVDLLAVSEGQRILDYGCGDGHLLRLIAERWPTCELVGYDPMPSQLGELRKAAGAGRIEATAETGGLADASFDRIACCEVLEHLPEREQRRVLADIRRLLRPEGMAIITVPVEIGPASLGKNLVRWAIGESYEKAAIGNILRASLGLRCVRDEAATYISGHVGFRHCELPPRFAAAGLRVLRRGWSPLPWIGPLLNSQVLYRLKRAES